MTNITICRDIKGKKIDNVNIFNNPLTKRSADCFCL